MTHRGGTALVAVGTGLAQYAPEPGEDPALHARFRAVSAFRHDMQHCVGVLREFFSRQVCSVQRGNHSMCLCSELLCRTSSGARLVPGVVFSVGLEAVGS